MNTGSSDCRKALTTHCIWTMIQALAALWFVRGDRFLLWWIPTLSIETVGATGCWGHDKGQWLRFCGRMWEANFMGQTLLCLTNDIMHEISRDCQCTTEVLPDYWHGEKVHMHILIQYRMSAGTSKMITGRACLNSGNLRMSAGIFLPEC